MLEYALRQERTKFLNLQQQISASKESPTTPNTSADAADKPPENSDGPKESVITAAASSSTNALTKANGSSAPLPQSSQPSTVSSSQTNLFQTSSNGYGNLILQAGGTLLNYSKGFGHARSREILKNYLREVGYLLASTGATATLQSSAQMLRGSIPFSLDESNAASSSGSIQQLKTPADQQQSRIASVEHSQRSQQAASASSGTSHQTREAGRLRADSNSGNASQRLRQQQSGLPVSRGPTDSGSNVPRENSDTPPSLLTGKTPNGKISALKSSGATSSQEGSGKIKPEADGGAANGTTGFAASGSDKRQTILYGGNFRSSADGNEESPRRSVSTLSSGSETAESGASSASSSNAEDDIHAQETFGKANAEKINKMVSKWEATSSSKSHSPKKKQTGGLATVDGNAIASLSLNDEDVDEQAASKRNSQTSDRRLWRPRTTLRSHLDSVRGLAFHPNENALLSCSEDRTIKLTGIDTRRAHVDLEPVFTFRGHHGPVTSVAFSSDANICFSGSADATVRAWKVPSLRRETYGPYDPATKVHTFVGHSDIVWDIKTHPNQPVLCSASSDGSVKLWDTREGHMSLKTTLCFAGADDGSDDAEDVAENESESQEGAKEEKKRKKPGSLRNPTSLDWVHTDLTKLAVSYQCAVVKIFDIETTKVVLELASNETFDGTSNTQINKVACHPTMPLLITAHEDRHIRFFDLTTGEQSC
ncbi:hypothetical protein HK102_011506 [Quaeritorhiza haematococci]|nr:hypothetical protein HK102_011506 [Quaeritorhiza haematococci]